ncbi:nitrous oxide reductase accessory protein NosL [Marinobacter vulgaris]|uniref:Nitrous oxide reductase accessory protein NosL n=1 Tax=Marinobacter vulgaris TaxID=1928331 RepID=A0A2V3ZQZ7_9GAMM|nr:nitrous oxide reductase accessory protein NosL [Marinobacter vulgaris]PXX93747.1 nitrous oxide reductase accessory protein NosL [Marinobacter vulgaris]TSJ72235.1 nitrous oxide reductase accessory protein NosL [Marinobacter vulgaris]
MRTVNFKALTTAVMFAVFLVGCSETEEQVTEKPDPVHIESGDECHVCGMAITRFPGPKGEAITAREQQVHKFCSTRDMFAWVLQPENAKRDHTLYVHDMAQTDWERPDDTALIDAREAFFVVGSERTGAMGPTLASFASENSAVEFANEFGGEVVEFKDVTMDHLTQDMSYQNMEMGSMGSHNGSH